MIDLVVYCLLLFNIFDTPLLYYYINLRSVIIFCFSSWYMYIYIYLSLGISLSSFIVIVSELFCGELLENFAILLAILLPIKSPAASAVFWTTLFKIVLSAYIADCLAWSRSYWHVANIPGLYLPLKLLIILLPKFLPKFLAKIHSLLQVFNLYPGLNSALFFTAHTLINNYSNVNFIFHLLEFRTFIGNHNSMHENCKS